MEADTADCVTPTSNVESFKQVVRENNVEIVSGGNVFYNPVQEFNRDLSVAVLNLFCRRLFKEKQTKKTNTRKTKTTNENNEIQKEETLMYENFVPGQYYENGIRILEALSATGLRSIRYAKEVGGISEIIANDLSKSAVDSINVNIKHNGVEFLIKPSHANAMSLMYLSSTSNDKLFDAIDLDPYGCPTRFLDGAVQSLADGGLLLVTATDMAVLAGNTPEACYIKYGTVPLRMKCCHEMALRILLHNIETHANRYGKYIEPLLSVSVDFYIRVFVRIHTSQAKCKYSMSKQSIIYQCTGCDTFTLQPLGSVKPNPTNQNPSQVKFGVPTGPPIGTNCEHCGHKHHLGGPIWSEPMHDKNFVQELLNSIENEPLCKLGTQKRLIGVLSVIMEELPDIPLYYTLDKLCCVLKLEIMPILKFRSALLYEGYRVSFSHALKNSIKTDAPASVIWDILRSWSKRHPVSKERFLEGSTTKAILSKSCTKDYNFDEEHPLANPKSRKNALTRFQANPTPHWGPGTRATIMIGDQLPKRCRNQNKKRKLKQNEKSEKQISDSKQNKLDE